MRVMSLPANELKLWAQIGQFVGQRKLSVTSDTYTHVPATGER